MSLDPFDNFFDPTVKRSRKNSYERKKVARDQEKRGIKKYKEVRPGVVLRSCEWPTVLWVALDKAADTLGVPTSMLLRACAAKWLKEHGALPGSKAAAGEFMEIFGTK